MSDGFSKIVAILLCVIMMFIVPVFYMKEESERLKRTRILEEVIQFVDGVRNTGIMGREDYDRLENVMYSLGGGYRVSIEHAVHMYDREGENVLYYENMLYEPQIIEVFEKEEDYRLSKNDYIKILVRDREGRVVAWYGGSIKYEAY